MNFGDKRGDVHPAFTMVTTIFLRNHNRLAEMISLKHPGWNDEQVFQEARKFNIALWQNVVYGQWLEAMLGDLNAFEHNAYNEQVDGSINMAFSTAAFR